MKLCGRFSRDRLTVSGVPSIDGGVFAVYACIMEVPLSPDLLAKIRRLAAQQGRAIEPLIVEAVEQMVNYDEWFLGEVEKGLAEADQGKFVEHSEVRKLIDQRYPG